MEREILLSCGELKIHAVLTQPDHGDVRRVVLGVHGLGGSTQDEIQSGLAEEMGLFGAAMLRFDFPGHGQSPCDELTLPNCVGTVLTVAQEAKRLYPDVEDLCVFASGFGAYITLVALHDLLALPGRVKLVIQTPSVRMDQTILAMSRTSKETLRSMGKTTFQTPRPFDVTYTFYEQIRDNNVMQDYMIPILILQGEADDYIGRTDIQNFHRINEESKLVTIPGTSHRFLEEGAWDMVLDLTRDWFAYEQVLLSDWD